MLSRPATWKRVYAALAVTDIVLAGSRSPRARVARRLTKPLLMPCLAAFVTTSAGRARKPALQRAVLVAQALSWGGDVALLGGTRRSFLAGVTSFLGAHASYIVGFRSAGAELLPLGSGAKASLAIGMLGGPVMGFAAGREDPSLRWPVAFYPAALAVMVAASTSLDPQLGVPARNKIAAGAVAFLVSDSALGLATFILAETRAALDAFVMATYTSGQLLIADGVATVTTAQPRWTRPTRARAAAG